MTVSEVIDDIYWLASNYHFFIIKIQNGRFGYFCYQIYSFGSWNVSEKTLNVIRNKELVMWCIGVKRYKVIDESDEISFNANASHDKFFISYDVESLFTNIPRTETVNIAVDLIFADNPTFTINRTELKQLFHIATSETHFLFDGKYYDQTDGVAMGSLSAYFSQHFYGFSRTKLDQRL